MNEELKKELVKFYLEDYMSSELSYTEFIAEKSKELGLSHSDINGLLLCSSKLIADIRKKE